MAQTFTIMRRELAAYFNTPIGYVFLVFFLLLSKSFFVLLSLFVNGVAEMRSYFSWLPILFLIFVPAIAMRLWAEERKLGTLELLMTFPVRSWHAVVGKFLAGMCFLAIMLILTLDLPLALWLLKGTGPGPDWGPIVCGYLGAIALGMVYMAIGAFASSLTSDQIVAFVIGATLNSVLFLIGFEPFVRMVRDLSPNWGGPVAATIQRFGVNYHFDSICCGVVDSRDILYALTMTAFFLYLNVLVVERRR